MSNDAICTSANGRDMITEIREPLGRGIDHAREAVAILGVSFRVRIQRDALKAYSANAESLQASDVDAAETSGVKNPAQPVYGRTPQRSRVLSASCTNLDAR